jgi:hypothetical protein
MLHQLEVSKEQKIDFEIMLFGKNNNSPDVTNELGSGFLLRRDVARLSCRGCRDPSSLLGPGIS